MISDSVEVDVKAGVTGYLIRVMREKKRKHAGNVNARDMKIDKLISYSAKSTTNSGYSDCQKHCDTPRRKRSILLFICYQYALFWGEVEGERRAKFPTVASRATRQDFRCDATAFLAS